MENGHQDTSEGNSESAEVDPYEKKYFALLKRCETTQQVKLPFALISWDFNAPVPKIIKKR